MAEGTAHQHQRRALSPAFSHAHVLRVSHVFLERAEAMAAVLHSIAACSGGCASVDILTHLNRASLDMICRAGFGYAADSIHGSDCRLSHAYRIILASTSWTRFWDLAPALNPWLALLPLPHRLRRRRARREVEHIALSLVRERRLAASSAEHPRDLLSLIVKGASAGGEPLTDKMLCEQLIGFMVAGHETTATMVAWAMYHLARNADVQHQLRRAVSLATSGWPMQVDIHQLEACTLLTHVIMETLRVESAVPATARAPVCALTLPSGVRLAADDIVLVNMQCMHFDESVWGPRARIFDPRRWEELPDAAQHGALLGSFIWGPRTCIGRAFAEMEMRVLLAALVRAFTFELDGDDDPVREHNVVQRPSGGIRLKMAPIRQVGGPS